MYFITDHLRRESTQMRIFVLKQVLLTKIVPQWCQTPWHSAIGFLPGVRNLIRQRVSYSSSSICIKK